MVRNANADTATSTGGFTYVAVTKVAASDDHGCVILSNGALYCWGNNTYGQLGDGADISNPPPLLILPSGVADVAAVTPARCSPTGP